MVTNPSQPKNSPSSTPAPPVRRPHPRPTPHASLEVDRALRLLRTKIHERGFTQLRVQTALGWGRTYISQLLRRQKSLRFDQILQILEIVEVDPAEFFAELYDLRANEDSRQRHPKATGVRLAAATLEGFERRSPSDLPEGQELRQALLLMMRLLVDKAVIDPEDLGGTLGPLTAQTLASEAPRPD